MSVERKRQEQLAMNEGPRTACAQAQMFPNSRLWSLNVWARLSRIVELSNTGDGSDFDTDSDGSEGEGSGSSSSISHSPIPQNKAAKGCGYGSRIHCRSQEALVVRAERIRSLVWEVSVLTMIWIMIPCFGIFILTLVRILILVLIRIPILVPGPPGPEDCLARHYSHSV
ncbi:hypothetical protein B0T26DRAFT_677670 [Lasiosphaeria miniovina]|uniref:Uncharacterized protein n=1 Tax=Lasiosphaeria miniovina TaxID=1954250 RepID=A0AA40ACS2_9PEZI|nr:uncharacterized protein B0T26DRAFT_677670 [Lasiosphaeria miniovina]KAK0713323.1 hypothetical protein B0T26DRAFT_677670 [Lasiosphaeria miniovina]